jgi:hypothetical protein
MGAMPCRDMPSRESLPSSWWHGYDGYHGSQSQSHDGHAVSELYGQTVTPVAPLDLADAHEACEAYAAYTQHTVGRPCAVVVCLQSSWPTLQIWAWPAVSAFKQTGHRADMAE